MAAEKFACEKLLPDKGRKPSYDLAGGGERCEGFYQQQVAGPYLEVVSVSCGIDVAPPKGQPLTLYAAPAAPRLVIQPLVQGIPYRVDLLNGANGAQWLPDEMLTATGLRFASLGYLAELPSSVPNRLDFAPTLAAKPSPSLNCSALIRSSIQTKEMRWRTLRNGQTAADWQLMDGGAVNTWGLARLAIAPGSSGALQVIQIQARRVDGSLLPILQFGVLGL